MRPLLAWLGLDRTDTGQPSVWSDLRTGRAGWPLRLGLSLAAAALSISTVMFCLGMIEASGGYIRDEHLAIAMAFAGVLWCIVLAFLWAGYGRWTRVLRTIFAVLGVWAVIIPTCVFIEETFRSAEYLIAGCVLLGIGATIGLVATAAYRVRGYTSVLDRSGAVSVICTRCGYSLVGLTSCQCPECGEAWTIDGLIDAQRYDAHRPDVRPEVGAIAPDASTTHGQVLPE